MPAEIVVKADREKIFRVLINLARNASQAMANGSEITVAARCGKTRVIVEFGDNGPGLLEIAWRHLFEPFAGSTRAGGTVLGLIIAVSLSCAWRAAAMAAQTPA